MPCLSSLILMQHNTAGGSVTIRNRQNAGEASDLGVAQSQCLVLHHDGRDIVQGVASEVIAGICSQ